MSPEQFLNAKQVDHRADLWSLAVVAYQALTARLPFAGEAVGAVAVAVYAGEFPLPSTLRPGLPPAVDQWMARALVRDPAARFGSAKEMAASLEQAAGGAVRRTVAPGRSPDAKRHAAAQTVAVPARRDEMRRPPPTAPAHHGRNRVQASAMSELKIGSRRIEVVKKHIVKAGTEAIVSTADQVLSPHFDGICEAIHRAAGPELAEMTRRHGRCAPGGAVITGAGRIRPPTRFIIHAVGPKYSADRDAECAVLLRSAYDSSLRLAEENGARSVAFPAISTGAFGYPAAKAAAIALRTVADYLGTTIRSVELVVFVLITDVSYHAFAKTLATLSGR
jgi:serine/threonine-protein kinase